MYHPKKIKYKLINTKLLKILFRLIVTIYLFIYLIYVYGSLNIEKQIYTDVNYLYKELSQLHSLTVCFNMTETEFKKKFCEVKFERVNCYGFQVILEENFEKYEVNTRSFYDKVWKEELKKELNAIFFDWSGQVCIKYESKISVKNRYFYSIRLCDLDSNKYENLLIRIYIHERDYKIDFKKDYVFKYLFNEERAFNKIDINFDKTRSLLLPLPFWTSCRNYNSNLTRTQCYDLCIIKKFNLKNKNYLNLIDKEYEYIKKNTTIKNNCVVECPMNCESSFYLVYSIVKEKFTNQTNLSDQQNLLSPKDDDLKCNYHINLREKTYFKINEAISQFNIVPFIMDLSNLACILFGFKFQNLIYKLVRKIFILTEHSIDTKNLNFLSIYIGIAIALLQFIYYLNEFVKFDTIKKMQIGKNNSIESLSVSICFEPIQFLNKINSYKSNYDFLIQNLNYNKDKELEFLNYLRSSILNISIHKIHFNRTELDNFIYNMTRIFFKDLCICFQIRFFIEPLKSLNTNQIYFGYFLLNSNTLFINFNKKHPYKHFFITDNFLPAQSDERFFNEEKYIVYENEELKSPYTTDCIDFKSIYGYCESAIDCYERCLFLEHFKKNKIIVRYLTYTVDKYGHYFKDYNKSDNFKENQKLDVGLTDKCKNEFKQNDCLYWKYMPVKEDVNLFTKNYIKLSLNYFFIKSHHIENFSSIEMFFNFCSLIYLWTGISFNFLLRKLSIFLKGVSFKLTYTFGLFLLQYFMILQIQSIFNLYEENSNIPSMYTITTIEMLPPAISLCFYMNQITRVEYMYLWPKARVENFDGFDGNYLNKITYNFSELIEEITFIDEELNINFMNSNELNELYRFKKYKNLLFDDFYYNLYKCYCFHIIYNNLNRFDIRLEDMLNIRIRDQELDYAINVHQENDFTMNNINKVKRHSNIDIKYRQYFYSKSNLDIFRLIKEYEHIGDIQDTDFEKLYNNQNEIFNQTTLSLPLFRKHFSLIINNTFFKSFDKMHDEIRSNDVNLRKRIILDKNINISYDILISYMNHSIYDIRLNPHLSDTIILYSPKIQFHTLMIYFFACISFWNETSILNLTKRSFRTIRKQYKKWKLKKLNLNAHLIFKKRKKY